VSIILSEALMHSDSTPHAARRQGDGTWRVTWLPDRTLSRDQALTAMKLAELIDAGLERGNRHWPSIDSLAAELGMFSPAAIIRVGTTGRPES
jgi:hypothetical protein